MLSRDIARVLPELQREAEGMMQDACKVTRHDPDAAPVIIDGIEVPAPPTTIYQGKCETHTDDPYEQTPDVGGQTITRQRYWVKVPVPAGPFQHGDLVEITSSVNAPSAVGRELRIATIRLKTWQKSQRFLVDEGEVTT